MQSKSTGKPALVLFTADWCPPCKQLKSETLSDAKVKVAIAASFTPVVVDLSDRDGPNNRVAQDTACAAFQRSSCSIATATS